MADDGPLIASDDLPLHQTAETLLRVGSLHPKWTERWYFNLQGHDGTLHGICGGGFYPYAGILEVYACVLVDGVQHNLRQQVRERNRERVDAAEHIQFTIVEAMKTWAVRASGPAFALDLRFTARQVPYLFPPFFVAADPPHQAGALEFDSVQHFVQPGTFTATDLEGVSFRDRTWGVRTARPRLHNWYVFHLPDGAYLNLIHQERADGRVMVSHLSHVDEGGAVRTGVLDTHALEFDPHSRTLLRARYDGHDGQGCAIALEVENTGPGIRLLGAGYTSAQGEVGGEVGDEGAAQVEAWDLADDDLVTRIGRGTIDSPARAALRWDGIAATGGIGVTETAVARDHWRYGSQLRSRRDGT